MNEWRRCPWICPGLLMSHKQSNRQSHRMQNRGKFCLAVFIIPGQCTHTLCVCWALLLNNATQSWSQRAGLSAACQQGLSARGCMPEYKHTLPQARFGCCCCICLFADPLYSLCSSCQSLASPFSTKWYPSLKKT